MLFLVNRMDFGSAGCTNYLLRCVWLADMCNLVVSRAPYHSNLPVTHKQYCHRNLFIVTVS
jgi:hypothetical protein